MKTGDSSHQPSQAARVSELFYQRAITKMLQHQPDILHPDAGAGRGPDVLFIPIHVYNLE